LSLVIDCSVAICWLMPDERAAAADRAIRAVIASGAEAPALFTYEVANVLLVNERRKRISSAAAYLGDLGELDLRIDAGSRETVARSVALALRFGLTVYDATYLELAQRRALPLATLDRELRRAAEQAGVPLLSP
jgi:predicted nucleic acid-binding protein